MCDCLVALPEATEAGHTLFAKNSDRPPGEPQDVAWSPPRRDRGPLCATHLQIAPHPGDTLGALLSRPRWCWGAEHGVNEAGVAIGNESIFTTLDPRRFPPALIGMDLVRLGLERSATAHQAVEVITGLLERYGQGGSGQDPHLASGAKPYWSSFLVADPTDAWVVETSGRQWAAEQVDVGTRAISNRTTIPVFDEAHRHPRQPVERLVDPRLRASQRVLAVRPVTALALMAHLSSHVGGDDGWTVCMHAGHHEVTTASMVAELVAPPGRSTAWVLVGSPCSHDFVEVVVGEPFELLSPGAAPTPATPRPAEH